jgi:hypothetical protein
VHDRGKVHQEGIPNGFDDGAVMSSDCLLNDRYSPGRTET